MLDRTLGHILSPISVHNGASEWTILHWIKREGCPFRTYSLPHWDLKECRRWVEHLRPRKREQCNFPLFSFNGKSGNFLIPQILVGCGEVDSSWKSSVQRLQQQKSRSSLIWRKLRKMIHLEMMHRQTDMSFTAMATATWKPSLALSPPCAGSRADYFQAVTVRAMTGAAGLLKDTRDIQCP